VREPSGVCDQRVLDAEVERLGRVAAEVGDARVVRVQDEPRRASSGELGPARGDRLELAVAVELVSEQVPEDDRARLERGGDRGEPELVDLEEAEPRLRASSEERRRAMFAPATLWTVGTPARSRIDAASAVVVVLPLVAETSTLPSGSVRPRRPMAPGSSRRSTLPGRLVPP
jgi:hypothetical protein